MAMQKCGECGKDVSSKAKQCPNCGAPVKAKAKRYGCLPTLIIVGLVVWGLVAISNYSNSPQGMAAANKREIARQTAEAQRESERQAKQTAQDARHAKLRDDAPTMAVGTVVRYYADNEVAGDSALKDTWFKVEGEVDRVGKDVLNTSFVILKDGPELSVRSVQCFFDDSHNDRLAELRPGQHLVVFGRCKGLMMNVLMDKCEIVSGRVEATPPAAVPVSATPTDQFVIAEFAEERLAPDATAAITNRVYKGQAVKVYEVQDGWARVSEFYDGSAEGRSGPVARWMAVASLSTEKPDMPKSLSIPADPRIPHLTRTPGGGLDERDVLILHAAARYYMEIGRATGIEDGDKSVSKPGTYYLNFKGEVQNTFFVPGDIPDLERRIQQLTK